MSALRGPQHGGSGWADDGRGAHSRRSAFGDAYGADGASDDDDARKYRGDKPPRLDAVNTAPGRVSDRQVRPSPPIGMRPHASRVAVARRR